MKPNPFRVANVVHATQDQRREVLPCVVAEKTAVPLLMPNLWLLARRRTVAYSTLEGEARNLVHLLRLAGEHTKFDLDKALQSGRPIPRNFLEFVLVPWLKRNASPRLSTVRQFHVVAHTYNRRLLTALQYIRYRYTEHLLSGRLSLARVKAIEAYLNETEKILIDCFLKASSEERLSLDSSQRAQVAEAASPGSSGNPWKGTLVQRRNRAMLMTLNEAGIRRGELASLKTVDVYLIGDEPSLSVVERRNDPSDTRRRLPGQKGISRIVPLRPEAAALLQDYIRHVRPKLAARGPGVASPFLFLSSRNGLGISLSQVNRAIGALGAAAGRRMHPHILRHGFIENFMDACEAQGLDEEATTRDTMTVAGWRVDNTATYSKRRRAARSRETLLSRQDTIFGQTR